MIHTDGQPTIAHRTEAAPGGHLTREQARALAQVLHDLRYTDAHPDGRPFSEIGPLWWDLLDALAEHALVAPHDKIDFVGVAVLP